MGGIIKLISSILLSVCISGGISTVSETTPQEAATDFFAGLTGDNQQTMEYYMDNQYINFLENVKGTDEEMDRMEKALFKNFSYKITDTATRGDVAVCKVSIVNSDFSNVLKDYEKTSYKYVMDNLYDKKVTDKAQLNKACLDMYIETLEKTAEKEPTYKTEIYLPLKADGFNGWRVVLSDEIMQSILGGLSVPEAK